MTSRILALVMMLLGLVAAGAAQQAACSAFEVPVGVINSNGESFRGLAPQDFISHAQKGSVAVKSLAYDDGPRRMLLIVDTSSKLSANAHRAAAELVKTLVAASRPEDSLAMITVRGPGGLVKFGEDRSAFATALTGTGDTARGKDRGVLDGVMEAIEWFPDSRPGDAIVVIAAGTEGNHKANAKSVARALAERHIRLFGLALGPVATRNLTLSGSITSTISQGLAWTTPTTGDLIYNTGDEDFYPLTANSGGLVVAVMNQDSNQSDKIDDPRAQQFVRSRAQLIANAVDSFYRMQIEPPRISHAAWWSLEVRESIRKHAPAMFVLFPHELGPC